MISRRHWLPLSRSEEGSTSIRRDALIICNYPLFYLLFLLSTHHRLLPSQRLDCSLASYFHLHRRINIYDRKECAAAIGRLHVPFKAVAHHRRLFFAEIIQYIEDMTWTLDLNRSLTLTTAWSDAIMRDDGDDEDEQFAPIVKRVNGMCVLSAPL